MDKMRKKMTQFGKQHKELPQMQISFHTRAHAMESCFGDPRNEQPNIAASILDSIKKLNPDVRLLVCQNIVLSGGSSMIPGFKKRLTQELEFLIDNVEQYKELETLKKHMRIQNCFFPPNVLTWVGASIVSSLNGEIGRFETTF